jgi:hypothetical protein
LLVDRSAVTGCNVAIGNLFISCVRRWTSHVCTSTYVGTY